MLRRRRAVLGQRVAARYPWPLENEAAVRLGRESAAQSPLHRSLGSGGEGSVEGFYPGNVGGQALTGIAALEELRHRNDVDVQSLAVRDARFGWGSRAGGDLPVTDRSLPQT